MNSARFTGWRAAAAIVGFTALAATQQASALVVHTGADPDGTTTNSDAAYQSWQNALTGTFTVDDMTGFNGTTSNLGNSFASSGGAFISSDNFTNGVIQGEHMDTSIGNSGGFVWTLFKPADAFGFFGYDNDSGTITIDFNDGTAQSFNTVADSLFWGVTGLAGLVSSVTVTTTDPGGVAHWDNFVVSDVPLPATTLLFGLGLAGLGLTRRNRS